MLSVDLQQCEANNYVYATANCTEDSLLHSTEMVNCGTHVYQVCCTTSSLD